MQSEEGVDLEQYVKPGGVEKKKKSAWLNKGARAVAATGIALGSLAATHLEAGAQGPDATPTPITTTVKPEGPKPTPTPDAIARQHLKELEDRLKREAEEKKGAEEAEAERQKQVALQNLPQEPSPQTGEPRVNKPPITLEPKDRGSIVPKESELFLGLFGSGLFLLGGVFVLVKYVLKLPGLLIEKFKESLPSAIKKRAEVEKAEVEKAEANRKREEILDRKTALEEELLREKILRQREVRARRAGGAGTPPPATPTP